MFCLLENQHSTFMKQVFIIFVLHENLFVIGKLSLILYTISQREVVEMGNTEYNDCPYKLWRKAADFPLCHP